jgi:hypothetical protein
MNKQNELTIEVHGVIVTLPEFLSYQTEARKGVLDRRLGKSLFMKVCKKTYAETELTGIANLFENAFEEAEITLGNVGRLESINISRISDGTLKAQIAYEER